MARIVLSPTTTIAAVSLADAYGRRTPMRKQPLMRMTMWGLDIHAVPVAGAASETTPPDGEGISRAGGFINSESA